MAGALSMAGHIDGVFRTVNVEVRQDTTGEYVDGVWVPGVIEVSKFPNVTIQPLSDLELEFFLRAEQRIIDARKLYINSGPLENLLLNDAVWFLDQKWKVIKRDVRPWRRYAKIMVDRFDDQ